VTGAGGAGAPSTGSTTRMASPSPSNTIAGFRTSYFLMSSAAAAAYQGLTLVHFSAQPEPSLPQNTP
jgi:hypothetical protein